MNVKDFKVWFEGLIAGIPEGGTLSANQYRALVKAVRELSEVKDPVPDAGSGSKPAQAPVPSSIFDIIIKENEAEKKRKQDQIDRSNEPLGWPYDSPRYYLSEPTYGDLRCGTLMDPDQLDAMMGQLFGAVQAPAGNSDKRGMSH
jgi:hypothetical protein